MLGAALPMLYSYTFAVVQNQRFALFPALDPNTSYDLNTYQVVLSIFFAVISLFSVVWLMINSSGKNNRQKKEIQAIYWVYAASLLVCILPTSFFRSLCSLPFRFLKRKFLILPKALPTYSSLLIY
jgi:hypothetical protein